MLLSDSELALTNISIQIWRFKESCFEILFLTQILKVPTTAKQTQTKTLMFSKEYPFTIMLLLVNQKMLVREIPMTI